MTFLQWRKIFKASRHLFLQRCYHSGKRDTLPSFGIAFDIDGVILKGRNPIGGAAHALRRLYKDFSNPCTLEIPFVFLTNGGGIPESKRAHELSDLLEIHISPHQVLQGHTPFRRLTNRFDNDLVLAIGKGEPENVMLNYGFRKVVSMDEYASYFQNIDPLAPYKHWTTKVQTLCKEPTWRSKNQPDSQSMKIHAAFVVSDPVDWGRDIQVLCDVMRSGGLPGRICSHQPPLFFASDDLEYQGAFPTERLGMGAFRIALEAIFNRVQHTALEYTSFGKPNATVFKDAEAVLQELSVCLWHGVQFGTLNREAITGHRMKMLYMVGDNPAIDVHGARQAGAPWFSILTRTGCFKGQGNHDTFPADLVVDTVEAAVEYILRRHSEELSWCLQTS